MGCFRGRVRRSRWCAGRCSVTVDVRAGWWAGEGPVERRHPMGEGTRRGRSVVTRRGTRRTAYPQPRVKRPRSFRVVPNPPPGQCPRSNQRPTGPGQFAFVWAARARPPGRPGARMADVRTSVRRCDRPKPLPDTVAKNGITSQRYVTFRWRQHQFRTHSTAFNDRSKSLSEIFNCSENRVMRTPNKPENYPIRDFSIVPAYSYSFVQMLRLHPSWVRKPKLVLNFVRNGSV